MSSNTVRIGLFKDENAAINAQWDDETTLEERPIITHNINEEIILCMTNDTFGGIIDYPCGKIVKTGDKYYITIKKEDRDNSSWNFDGWTAEGEEIIQSPDGTLIGINTTPELGLDDNDGVYFFVSCPGRGPTVLREGGRRKKRRKRRRKKRTKKKSRRKKRRTKKRRKKKTRKKRGGRVEVVIADKNDLSQGKIYFYKRVGSNWIFKGTYIQTNGTNVLFNDWSGSQKQGENIGRIGGDGRSYTEDIRRIEKIWEVDNASLAVETMDSLLGFIGGKRRKKKKRTKKR